MKSREIEAHIEWLEELLNEFRKTKKKGKETNSNEIRAQSIKDIEEITRRLEEYIRNNEELTELIAGTRIEPETKVDWNDIVRPKKFEEDLQAEIEKLKQKV